MNTKLIYVLFIFFVPIVLGQTYIKPKDKTITLETVTIQTYLSEYKYKDLIDSVRVAEMQVDSTIFETEIKLHILKEQQEFLIENK